MVGAAYDNGNDAMVAAVNKGQQDAREADLKKKMEERRNASPQHRRFFDKYLRDKLGQAPQTAPQFESPEQAAVRGQQQGLLTQLLGVAGGQTAGAGELAVNRQVGQSQAAQVAQAQSARGGNTALANRMQARNNAELGVQGAGMAAQAQMQDQTNAQAQASQLAGMMRGADIGIGQGNQSAQLTQTGMNNQQELGYLAQMLGMDQATLQAYLQNRQLNIQEQANKPDRLGQLLGAAGTIAGGFAA